MTTTTEASFSIDIRVNLETAQRAEGPTTSRTPDGQVRWENDSYKIDVSDDGTVHVFNKETGEDYRVWGDPHVAVDGKQAFDFYGDTTFVLDDGSKLTIQTKPAPNNDSVTYASQVTITDGASGETAQISGVDPFTRGDLEFTEYAALGGAIEAAVDDGNTIYENPFGSGFIGVDANGGMSVVDQAFINDTDLMLNGQQTGSTIEPSLEAALQPYANMIALFSGLVGMVFSGSLAGLDLGGNEGAPDMTHGLPAQFSFSLSASFGYSA
ncbi:DUF1521 domain-containing protein [Coralloluteibacterium stylophorae]|uniref:DUF1521 domain-containing protein n=1 Tax=Coralloluteibacterium stylophorae TaxID=1776034 RepID=A0A8J7VV08_9GAMM|nr:DUF1521 domain-containing protein [Coralloluteibacterium stylophorae]MBS7456375.1 DUF1521 domain-containing protein [Coralloluteibacterium stylophorae]